MRNGLLFTTSTDLVRRFGEAVAGTDGAFRVRNSAETFVSEITNRIVDWVAIDFSEDSNARRMLFNRVPQSTDKYAIVLSDSPVLQPTHRYTPVLSDLEIEEFRTVLGFTQIAQQTGRSYFQGTVLIADKDSYHRTKLAEDLTSVGFEVVFANHAIETVHLARELHPTIIIAGWSVFSTPATDICRTIRRINIVPIPQVILTTEKITNERLLEATAAGANSLHEYPLEIDRIVRRVTGLSSQPKG